MLLPSLHRSVGSETAPQDLHRQKILFVLLAVFWPALILITMFMFTHSAYIGGLNPKDFLAHYSIGVFRFRLLGIWAVLGIDSILTQHFRDHLVVFPLDPHASFLMYVAFVLVNSVGLIASNLLLLWVLWKKGTGFSDVNLLQYFFLTLLVALSLAIFTPYDMLAYAFLMATLLATRVKRVWLAYSIVAVFTILGALTRESQALTISTFATLGLFLPRRRADRLWHLTGISIVLFSAVYLGLRIAMGFSHGVAGKLALGGEFRFEMAPLYLMLLIMLSYTTMRQYSDSRPYWMCIALFTPYLLVVILTGAYAEIRLLVPMCLCLVYLYAELARDLDETIRQQPASVQ